MVPMYCIQFSITPTISSMDKRNNQWSGTQTPRPILRHYLYDTHTWTHDHAILKPQRHTKRISHHTCPITPRPHTPTQRERTGTHTPHHNTMTHKNTTNKQTKHTTQHKHSTNTQQNTHTTQTHTPLPHTNTKHTLPDTQKEIKYIQVYF